MNEKKYTSGGLPVVSKDILEVMNRDLKVNDMLMVKTVKDSIKDSGKLDVELLRPYAIVTRIATENMALLEYIVSLMDGEVKIGDKQRDDLRDPAFAFYIGAITIYEALA